VGSAVGEFVGFLVGKPVGGLVEGELVGGLVGDSVGGLVEGELVGGLVEGFAVGPGEGALEARFEGACEGAGLLVGEAEARGVGASEGETLLEGAGVMEEGDAVGDSVIRSLAAEAKSTLATKSTTVNNRDLVINRK
jgi:hypothetical protein